MGSNTATVKHQTSVEIPQICLDSRFCTVHPFPFPEVQVQVHEDNSQSIGCMQSCGSLALPGCPRGVTSQEKGPRVRRLDPQCLEPIIDSSANGRVDDPFLLWPLRLNSKYKTELYRSRMMFTRLCHERLLGAELDPILPGLNRSWDPDPSFSACHLSSHRYHPKHHPNHDAAWSADGWFTQEGRQGSCKRTRSRSSSGGAGNSSFLIRCCFWDSGSARKLQSGDRFPDLSVMTNHWMTHFWANPDLILRVS